MGRTKVFKLELPEWTYQLPDRAYLSSRELADILGYKKPCSLALAIDRGLIPQCDARAPRTQRRKPLRQWSLKCLRAWEAKQDDDSVIGEQ